MADPGKRRGRPPLRDGEETESVPVRLPRSVYDAVCREALAKGVSVSAVVRAALRPVHSTTSTT
jgi:hypothetical protein